MKKQIVLMDRARMERTLKRMAIQVWERINKENEGEMVLIGLNERGEATARLLGESLEELMGTDIEVYRYDVQGKASKSSLPDCNDKFVLLVDDVIFSGKTMFSALSAVCSVYEPESIEIAALLDRGHRKYPLRTDLMGIKVPTKPGEHIEVMLKDGNLSQAILFKNN
ncbi:phosphoribosyltransferase family protein [Gracilimonas sp.]|uniref:phosphoribosyltransferase family protein n=1 Tax=Gracilimonas sp. TaxID=1974203 RepID=UPI003BA9CA88